MNRRQFLGLGAFGALALAIRRVTPMPWLAAAQPPSPYTLRIEYGPLDVMTLRLTLEEVGMPTVYGLLQAATARLGVHLETADHGPNGVLVTSLRGSRNAATAGWHLFVNGIWINQSASLRPLQSGDEVVVRYRSVAPEFVRGDSNSDGELDVSDVVTSLNHKFGGRPAVCPDAADFDDDGILTVGDDVGLLDHLFRAGTNPPAPHPFSGPDPTSDVLGCRW